MSRVKKFDSLRGLACLIVLFAHLLSSSPRYGIYASGCGKIGVWCFMLLSGFFFMQALIQNPKTNIANFYYRRILKLYPTYIIALIFASAIGFIEIRDTFQHLTGLKGYGHFWYMPVILKFYLICPLFVVIYNLILKITQNNEKKTKYIYSIILLIACITICIIFPFTKYTENSINLYWSHICSSS